MMGWDIDIVHQNNHSITGTNYWSCLGTNLCFSPLFKTYLNPTRTLCLKNPPSKSFPMKPENMAYYRGPQVLPANEDYQNTMAAHYQTIVSTVMVDNIHGLCHLSNIPVQFRDFGNGTLLTLCPLHNNKFPCYAQQILQIS
jgi:hypothetical protein